MIDAVLPWKERIFRLQLQFFSSCYVGTNYCNVTSFLYRLWSFRNQICNKFISNGRATLTCLWKNKVPFSGPSCSCGNYENHSHSELTLFGLRMMWEDIEQKIGANARESTQPPITIGAKIITHTTFVVGDIFLQLHTHQLHNFNRWGINLCNACVSLVSVVLPLWYHGKAITQQ